MFETPADRAGGGGDFLGAETEFVGAAPFAGEGGCGVGPRGRGGIDREDELGVMLAVFAGERAGGAEVARVLAAELLKPLVQHRDDDFATHRGGAGGGGFDALRTGKDRDEFERQRAGGGFGVNEGGELVGIGGGAAIRRRRKRRGRSGPGGEVRANAFFEGVGGKIADREEEGVVGAIPGFVERTEGGGIGGGDRGLVADRIAPRAKMRRMDEVFAREGDARLPVIAGATFAFDDAAFAFEGGGIEGLLAGELAEGGKGFVEAFAGGVEGSVDLVDGVSRKREGGGVGPEGDAVTLQRIDNRVTRETTRAGEGHVFDEVREATLVVLFVERAGEDDEAEGHVIARLGVGEHDVAEAVREGAEAGVRVRREIARLVRPCGADERHERKQSEDEKPAAEEDHRE